MNNRTLLAKDAIDTSVLSSGGKMNPIQEAKFLDYMKDYSRFLRMIKTVHMQGTRVDMNTIAVNKRAMRQQKEGTDHTATGKVTTGTRQLQAVGVIMPYDVSFQFMKENIERKQVNTHLAQLFAKQFANDTVDLAWNGDESSEDEFLKINNGYLKIMEDDAGTHKVDTSGKNTMRAILKAMTEAMPTEQYQMYQQEDKSDITIWLNPIDAMNYVEEISERNTALGDQLLVSGKLVKYGGFEICPVGFIPKETYVMTPASNLGYGLLAGSLETYHDVKVRKLIHEYTLLGDIDFQIGDPDAVVIGKNRGE